MIRPAREDEVAALVAAYDWLFAPPGSQPPMWDPDAAARRLRALIAAGEVRVDGQVELRKTAKMRAGQVVEFAGQRVRVVAPG